MSAPLFFKNPLVLACLLSSCLWGDYVVNIAGDASSSVGGNPSSDGDVNNGDLRYVINKMNVDTLTSALTASITFDLSNGFETVTLSNILPPLNLFNASTFTLDGSNTQGSGTPVTISGNNAYRGLFIAQGSATVTNLTFLNCKALGGSSGLGGGGAGLGGALLIGGDASCSATVILNDLTFTGNNAMGGPSNVDDSAFGGGGLGGNGNRGGGGFSGNGGNSGGGGLADGGNISGDAGGGGGGALLGVAIGGGAGNLNGGQGSGPFILLGGGGGGSAVTGGAGGGNGGAGGGGSSNGQNAQGPGGGGGGGGAVEVAAGGAGGSGGSGGGGGGGGEVGADGGNGGFCGGGGSSSGTGTGGNGGFGGGGAEGVPGGNGGFGGGGGLNGNSGFGGGGSGGTTRGDAGGIGGGNGGAFAGGGGAGLGGAIFVTAGSEATFTGSLTLSGNTVTAGTGVNLGAAAGSDLFMRGGSVVSFSPSSGATISILTPIADDSLATIPAGHNYGPGTGPGAGFILNGAGTLLLSGVNTFAGTATVSAGTLSLSGSGTIPNAKVALNQTIFDISLTTSGAAILGVTGTGTVSLGSKTLTIGGATSSLFAGTIQDGGIVSATGGSLKITGPALQTFTGIHTYTGATTISSGTLALSDAGSIALSSSVNIDSTLDISGTTSGATLLGLIGSGTLSLGSQSVTLGGATSTTFGGKLQDGGLAGGIGASLIKVGTATQTLTGISSYTGSTTLSVGTLALSGSGSIDTSSLVTVNSTLDVSAATTPIIQDVTGTGLIKVGSQTLTLGGSIGATFAGILSGSGGIVKQGSGTQVFTATHSYTGPTTISTGTLTLSGSGSIASSSLVTVNALLDISNQGATLQDLTGTGTLNLGSATLTVGGAQGSTFSGHLTATTSANLIKQGNGTLILAAYSGINNLNSTQINAGTLSVNTTLPGTLTVGATGVLKGTGRVGNMTLTSGSKVAPGNSIGTLIIGSCTFPSGSIFQVEINGSGNASELISTGAVTVEEGAQLQVAEDTSSAYTVGTQYHILNASALTGATLFSIGSTQEQLGHQYYLSTDETTTDLWLILSAISPPPTAIPLQSVSGNNSITASYLNSLSGYAPLTPIVTTLATLSPADLNAALSAISPARNTFATFTLQNTAFNFSETLSARQTTQRFLRQTPQAAQVATLVAGPIMHKTLQSQGDTYSVWGSAIGSFAHEKEQDQTPAFDMTSGGLLVGYDNYSFKDLVLGTSFGYAYVDVHNKGSLGKQYINDYIGSFYTSLYLQNFFFDFAVWGGFNHGHSQRKIIFTGVNETAKASLNSWQVVPHFLLGYGYKVQETLLLQPFAQFDWAVNFARAFTEKGAGSLNMHQKAQTSSMLRSEVGLEISKMHPTAAGIFVARGHLSYVNKKMFSSGKATAAIVGAPGGSFIVETFTSMQNLVAPGLEAFYEAKNNVFLTLTWEGEFGSGYRANNAMVSVGKAF